MNKKFCSIIYRSEGPINVACWPHAACGHRLPTTVLDETHGKRFFTFLDTVSAYWCVALEEDKYKTAFTTP